MAFLVLHLGIQLGLPRNVVETLTQEDGIYENLQFLLIGSAFLAALWGLKRHRAHSWMAAYFALAAVCSFYVAAEEVSWGQRFFGWATPESWHAVNDHGETNLHNTYVWADKAPRVLLEVAICLGAFPIALLQKYKPGILPQRFKVIYPPYILAVMAGCLVFLKIIKPVAEQLEIIDFERLSEVHELYTYYFVLLYLLII